MPKIVKQIPNLTLSKIFELLSLLRLDVYFALFTFGFMIPMIPLSQFVQDKFCINQLKLDPSVCLRLEKLGSEYETIKNEVYTFSASFKNYQNLIATAPGVILSIFMGYWIDTYPSHLKYLLAFPCFGGCFYEILTIYSIVDFESNVLLLLWNSLFYGFTGGFFVVMTGSYTYITRRTRVKYRAARFAIFELFMFTSMPLATAVGGKILTSKPWLIDQHRNYMAVFLVSFLCKFVAMIWVLVFLNDADKTLEDSDDNGNDKANETNTINSNKQEIKFSEKSQDYFYNTPNNDKSELCAVELEPLKPESTSTTDINEIKQGQYMFKPIGCLSVAADIFNMSTVTNMMKVCCRKRANNVRCILWNLMLTMNVLLIGHMGEGTIGFPFAQKVYHWDAAYYSYISSMVMLVPTIINSMLPIILIHKFHLSDTTLSIIGSISLILSLTIRGGILEPYAFFVSVIFGICGGLLPIAVRSIISRIIDQKEIGQVFALLACIESSGPMVASLVYSTIFNLTIDKLPGLIHHFAALTMFYPFLVALWLDLTKYKWDKTAIKAIQENEKVVKNQIPKIDEC